MDLILGVDGGGTGCRAAVADPGGRVLGTAAAGPANIASDPDGAAANILTAARDALRAATGRDAGLDRLAAGLGLAGANARGAADRLARALPFARLRIETDAIAAAMGALGPDDDGIVAAIGTGSVYAMRHGGHLTQYGGWGLVLGDTGSGAWIGRAALTRALAASEGAATPTPLTDALLAERGGAEGVIAWAQSARPADFAALTPRLLAAPDDPAAVDVLAQARADIAAQIDRLRALAPLPVTFIGGLGAVAAGWLPHVPQRPARGTALDGALQIARDLRGATP
ncbi:MAG: ATPase [Rhodobacteraceae bacterium]|jgi:glucosamine kinase|nr:ATPase [Paracoccaceae bacterium]